MRRNWISEFTEMDSEVETLTRKFDRAAMEDVAILYSDLLREAMAALSADERESALARFGAMVDDLRAMV
jgi:hypothetical protein